MPKKTEYLGTMPDPFHQMRKVKKLRATFKTQYGKKLKELGIPKGKHNGIRRVKTERDRYLKTNRCKRAEAIRMPELIKMYEEDKVSVTKIARHYKVGNDIIKELLLRAGRYVFRRSFKSFYKQNKTKNEKNI